MKATHMYVDELVEQKIETKKDDVIFVTIGVPFSKIPIMQKVAIFVDFQGGETIWSAAKKLRKMVADNIEMHGWEKGTKFTPADLYYEIYPGVDYTVPISGSANCPHYNQAA